jgi:hypothetical protein
VSVDRDPVRLSAGTSEAPEELRSLLEQAKQDVPTDRELTHLAAALAPLAATTTIVSATAAKVVGALVVGGALVGGGAWLLGGSPRPETGAAQPAAASATAQPASVPKQPPPESEPIATPEPEASEVAPAPSVTHVPKRGSDVPTSSGVSEADLLQSAQAALRSNPRRALALTREHRRRFPNGALAQEREVIAIEALSKLGRTDDARGRAGRFKQQYPNSAHQRKVGSAVSDP